jgi:hypothetical protein
MATFTWSLTTTTAPTAWEETAADWSGPAGGPAPRFSCQSDGSRRAGSSGLACERSTWPLTPTRK